MNIKKAATVIMSYVLYFISEHDTWDGCLVPWLVAMLLKISKLGCRQCQRGAVVEWLEQLDYREVGRRKVVSSRLGFAMHRLENFLFRPSSEWVPY